MRVLFSRRSLAQIREIHAYHATEDARVARAIVRRIETVAALIGRHPTIGRSTSIAGIRAFSVLPYPYLVFYEIREAHAEVVILRVRHSARREDWREGR